MHRFAREPTLDAAHALRDADIKEYVDRIARQLTERIEPERKAV